LARAAHRDTIVAPRAGVVQSIDAYRVGVAAWRQGAGRARKEDPVSAGAGVEVLVRRGERVEIGQPLFVLHADDEVHLRAGHDEIRGALTIGDEPVDEAPLLFERVDASN
jgi:thymidine phosphorylase